MYDAFLSINMFVYHKLFICKGPIGLAQSWQLKNHIFYSHLWYDPHNACIWYWLLKYMGGLGGIVGNTVPSTSEVAGIEIEE